MDSNIAENTRKFAKTNIVKAMEQARMEDLAEKMIYVPRPPGLKPCNGEWEAALVDGATQSAKTWKAFDVIAKRTTPGLDTLVLFITQANSNMAANQIISRSRKDSQISKLFPTITRSSLIFEPTNNTMLVDFWHSRNADAMFQVVDDYSWDQIFIVIDEVDEGGKKGLQTRLDFVRRVEKAAGCPVRLVFVTATVANLSKSIVEIAKNQPAKFKSGVVNKIINDVCVEHHYVIPRAEYIGPSYFTTQSPSLWRKLVIPRKTATQSREEYLAIKNNIVNAELDKLTDEQKELCLIVTSTQRDEHRALAKKMFMLGFNVVVEMNGENNKNYNVYYRGTGATVKHWQIPYSDIESLAGRSLLDTYIDADGTNHETGIECKEDLTMPYIIQSALFMNTNAQNRISKNIEDEEMVKLRVIGNAICTSLDKAKRRPMDYPKIPRVALITGALAGRGNTFQNAFIDLACTSLCFVGKTDTAQRGATNAQRFGRACGMLSEIFINQNRQPVLIATQNIVQDALANETALKEKAESLKEGELVSLKSLITKADWDRAVTKCKTLCLPAKNTNVISIMHEILKLLAAHPEGLKLNDIKTCNPNLYELLESRHRRPLTVLSQKQYIQYENKKWKINELGVQYLTTNHVSNL